MINSKIRYALIAVAAVASLVWMAPDGQAAPGRHRRGGGFDQLELSDGTRSAIRDVLEQSKSATQAVRTRLREERGVLRELMQADLPDAAAVRDQIARVGATQIELRQARSDARLQAMALLTAEERQQLRELSSERRGRGWRGRGPDGRRGRGRGCDDASEPAPVDE